MQSKFHRDNRAKFYEPFNSEYHTRTVLKGIPTNITYSNGNVTFSAGKIIYPLKTIINNGATYRFTFDTPFAIDSGDYLFTHSDSTGSKGVFCYRAGINFYMYFQSSAGNYFGVVSGDYSGDIAGVREIVIVFGDGLISTNSACYVDGSIVSTANFSAGAPVDVNLEDLNVGAKIDGTAFYTGSIDSVTVYPEVILIAEEAKNLYNKSTFVRFQDPSEIWNYDQRRGAGADKFGASIVTPGGGITTDRIGDIYATNYHGVNYNIWGTDTKFRPAQLTLMGWVNANTYDLGSGIGIVFIGNSNVAETYGYGLILSQNDGSFYFSVNEDVGGGGWQPAFGDLIGLNPKEWYHVAGTYDGTTVKIYIDGVVSSTPITASSIEYNVNCNFSEGGWNIHTLDGWDSNWRLFSKDIGAYAIAQDFTSTKNLYGK